MKSSKALVAMSMLISQGVFAHAGHYDSAPWQVCKDKNVGDNCAYETHDKRYVGSCQAMQQASMCVRNQPIERLNKLEAPQTSKDAEKQNHSNQSQAF